MFAFLKIVSSFNFLQWIYVTPGNFCPACLVPSQIIKGSITKNNNEVIGVLHRMCGQAFIRSQCWKRNLNKKHLSIRILGGGHWDPPLSSCQSTCYQKQPAAFSVSSRRLTHKYRHSPTACHAC